MRKAWRVGGGRSKGGGREEERNREEERRREEDRQTRIRECGSVLYLGMTKEILKYHTDAPERSYYPPNQACRQNDTA